jgi:hypothetical protein
MNATTAELSLLVLMKSARYEMDKQDRQMLYNWFNLGVYLANTEAKKARLNKARNAIKYCTSSIIPSNVYVELDERVDELIEIFHRCRPSKLSSVTARFFG